MIYDQENELDTQEFQFSLVSLGSSNLPQPMVSAYKRCTNRRVAERAPRGLNGVSWSFGKFFGDRGRD